ncbi:hypothetical protein BpHYR1_027029 [Brachionus plicatilis]|uniref:RNA-directed DNA polymerase from mobile element jockey-like n=1 Tax=Brachionus plicatilis TaxID=10195 RepID=A0A3M7QWT6_BRAPC|nr:hypothetical protein BpHYR1_027029 [Brachionus plicatilis]
MATNYFISSSVTNKINEFRVLTNWHLFREVLNVPRRFLVASAGTIDEQNEIITKKILSAAQKSIPFQSQKVFKSSLPPFIVDLIKERRKIRRYFQKTRCLMTKQRYNHLTLEIQISLKKFWNQNWFDFIKKMGSNLIPTLTLNNQDFKTDEEKGKLF